MTVRLIIASAAWTIAALCVIDPVLAQEALNVGQPLAKEQLSSKLNLEVPSSVGFAILGISPDSVVTPRKGSELALGILNGLDQQGNFQTGLAFEANPYFWTLPDKVQLDKYLSDTRYRILSGFSFTFATSEGQGTEDEAERVGVGLNFSYDFEDPLFHGELNDCIFSVQDKILDKYSRERGKLTATSTIISRSDASDEQREAAEETVEAAGENLVDRLQARGEAAVNQCYKDNVGWNRTIFQLGIAAHRSDIGGDGPIEENGESIWMSYSHGLGQYYQLVVHASYGDDLLVASDDALEVTDRSFAGARIRVGSDTIRGFVEAGFTDEQTDSASDTFWNAVLGAEVHLTSNVFLQLAYGDTFGSNGDKEEYLSGQFKWALSPTSAFGVD